MSAEDVGFDVWRLVPRVREGEDVVRAAWSRRPAFSSQEVTP